MADVDILKKRMKEIEATPQLRLMRSADNEEPLVDQHIQQYLVYTDFKADQVKEKTNSIFVYTPWMNLDSQGRTRTDFQNQLLFDYNGWENSIHITVLETLGAASQLAFFDYQNHGLAQLSLQALIKLAERNNVERITASLSSFDGENDFARISYLFKKVGFTVVNAEPDKGVAQLEYNFGM